MNIAEMKKGHIQGSNIIKLQNEAWELTFLIILTIEHITFNVGWYQNHLSGSIYVVLTKAKVCSHPGHGIIALDL